MCIGEEAGGGVDENPGGGWVEGGGEGTRGKGVACSPPTILEQNLS